MNGPGMQAFLEAYQRTTAMLDQRDRQRQGDSLSLQDRQRAITRQDTADARATDVYNRGVQQQQQADALQRLAIPGQLAELGGTADSPAGAQQLIETALPELMRVFGQETMAFGQPAVEMAQRTITARQKRQVSEFVEKALKTSFVADNPESDPEVQNLPAHVAQAIGKPSARLSELQQFAELPVGKPAQPKTTSNPTEASIAMAAAGGDPTSQKAFGMLNPPKPEGGGGKTSYRFLKDRDGNIIEWPTDVPAPRGSRPYNETTQRQEDQKGARDETVSLAAGEALQLVQDLKTKAGMSGAVGAKGPTSLFGILDKPMGGTDAAGYRALYDSLKSKLTIPAMQQMRGLGAMSDREFRTMSDSVTALSTEMPEAMFRAELDKIEQALTAVVSRMQQSQQVQKAAPDLNAPGGGVNIRPIRKPIPGIRGGMAVSTDGGLTWKRES